MLACRADVDQDLVYQLTKGFWDNLEQAKSMAVDIKLWTNPSSAYPSATRSRSLPAL
jgi:TRAP-type uncharacterized transport system substrate-binding protein